MTNNTYPNREAWLDAAVNQLAPLFTRAGHTIPEKIRVSCGFPRGNVRKVVGQCWYPMSSTDETTEIFVSPTLDKPNDVLGTLAHELCHACLEVGTGHRAPFVKLGRAIGLEGKPKSMGAGPAFTRSMEPTLNALGPYPHASINVNITRKPQSTRMIKCQCPECGYLARTTRQWLAHAGPPLCPNHGAMVVD